MQGFRLNNGMHLLYAGREYVITGTLPNNDLQLKDIATNQYSVRARAELIESLFDGAIELLGDAGEYKRLKQRQEKTLVSDFNALEEDDPRKSEARWRLSYVLALADIGRSKLKFTREFLRPIIEKVGHQLGDYPGDEYRKLTHEQKVIFKAELKKAGKRIQPSPSSLYRWYLDWEGVGEDIRGLISATASKGNYERKISKDREKCNDVLRIIYEVIDTEYMTLERPSVQDAQDSLEARIRRENEFRSRPDHLPITHISTLYRIINSIDEYERDSARYGKRYADAKHKANKRGPRPTRPLERVEIDDTQLPMMVIDPVRLLPVGRPWLLLAIDVMTRMILGYYLSFIRPNYLSVMQCMLHSIRPKSYVQSKYPEIKNEWPTYGLMELVVVDNAKIYYSADFDEACYQAGIKTQYTKRRIAWDKPYVERVFGTQNRRLLRRIPGTTFSNIFEKADYDPKKHAAVDMGELDEMIHTWIIDIYHRSKHRGINDVPARLWEIGTKDYQPPLPPNNRELEVLLGCIEWRVIGPSGIELFGLLYKNDNLALLRRQGKKGEKVKVKFDPNDISLIWVYDKVHGLYLPIPAEDQEYTKGLSLWQHNVIRRYARQIVDGYVNRAALCEARERIQEIVNRGVERMRLNMKTSHWMSLEQQRNQAAINTNLNNHIRPFHMDDKDTSGIVLLNAESHPVAGISDVAAEIKNGNQSELNEETQLQSAGIETKPTREKQIKREQREASSDKQTYRKDGIPQSTSSKDDLSNSLDIDVNQELNLDTSGWKADYDLPR